MRHSFQIVHGSRFNPSDRTPDERAGHFSIGREPKLEERIADVVVAKEKPGIVNRDDFGSVVGLRAGCSPKPIGSRPLFPLPISSDSCRITG